MKASEKETPFLISRKKTQNNQTLQLPAYFVGLWGVLDFYVIDLFFNQTFWKGKKPAVLSHALLYYLRICWEKKGATFPCPLNLKESFWVKDLLCNPGKAVVAFCLALLGLSWTSSSIDLWWVEIILWDTKYCILNCVLEPHHKFVVQDVSLS